jgi:microcystin-dependent protein
VNFALPDLRARVPIHMGSGFTLGERGGEQAHTLSIAELPTHTHVLSASGANASQNSPNNAFLANATAVYHTPTSLVSLSPSSVANVGGSQPHVNMQPYLVLSFCIALQGIFPSQN